MPFAPTAAGPRSAVAPEPQLIIRPSSGWVPLRLADLVAYRELMFFLVWRDIKVRYKQTVLGALWAFIQPFLTMLVFSIFFGRLGGMNQLTGDIPYSLYCFAGLVPWTFFAFAFTQASESLVKSANLISKIYFPRLIVPLSAVVSGSIDFLVAFLTLLGMMFFFGFFPSWKVIFLPVVALFTVLAALGFGIWLAALNVQFRDVRYTVPFLTQFWMFLTPIAYPIAIVPETWRPIYALNPLVGVVESFRWCVLGHSDGLGPTMLISVVMTLAILVSGLYYFRRMEKQFADLA